MKELKRTVQNSQNSTATVQTKSVRLSKTHADYWSSRLTKRTYKDRHGHLVEVPEWHVRLGRDNRQGWFNLGTANQAAGAKKAREVYVFLEANGWEQTLAKFKPTSEAENGTLTVGRFLDAVKGTGTLRLRTFLNYQNCFRTILSELFGIRAAVSRFDYKTGGNQKWVQRIDSIRLERVTPSRITSWKQRRLKKAGNSPVAIASAQRTVNSYIRCARSLFSQDLLKAKEVSGLKLPSKLPFDDVELFEAGSMKYVSKVDVQALIAAARNELKKDDPEAYKVFLLGLFVGLRRAEIDSAEWSMINWSKQVLGLVENEWLHLKTPDSAAEITIDAELLAELREMQKPGAGKFIVKSDRPPRNDSARPYYRCEPIFERLTEWLRAKGVTANKPIHEMRKEIGALITKQHGIYAASRFLRHSDITTTARHYADHKGRISAGLGKLLCSEIKTAATTCANEKAL